MVRRLLVIGLILLGIGVAPLAHAADVSAKGDLTWEEVHRFRQSGDAFSLRDRLARAGSANGVTTRIGRALAEHAFHDPAASNASIRALVDEGEVPDSVRTQLRMLAINNHLHLFEYVAGLAVVDRVVSDSSRIGSETLHDARNFGRILRALRDVPPQTMKRSGESRIALVQGRIPVVLGDSTRHYIFDTGANLSTIMRSEARARGLRVLPAGIDVGTSTDRRVTADLGVASSLRIGAMEFENVVFLVLDDSMLTFGPHRLEGIIGFPVIAKMGEVRFHGTDELFVPGDVPERSERNLALHGLELLTTVRWEGERLLSRLDTGANRTQFYEPAYRRLRSRIDANSRPAQGTFGGAGGIREMPVRRLDPVRLEVGGAIATLDSVDVLVQSIVASESENDLDVNLGHDVFDQFDEMILNFRDMAVLLREPKRATDRKR